MCSSDEESLQDRQLFDDSVDWCLVNNCQTRWALRWKHLEEDITWAEQEEKMANAEQAAATTKAQIRHANARHNAAIIARNAAREGKISLMLQQSLANRESLRHECNAYEEKIKAKLKRKKDCFEQMAEDKTTEALVKRVRKWDEARGITYGKPSSTSDLTGKAKPPPNKELSIKTSQTNQASPPKAPSKSNPEPPSKASSKSNADPPPKPPSTTSREPPSKASSKTEPPSKPPSQTK